MKTVQPNIAIAILALASLNAVEGRVFLNAAKDAADAASAPKTLGEAVDASNQKHLVFQSRTEALGNKLLPGGLVREVPFPEKPQTLSEAVHAGESKYVEVRTGGLAVEIVDRDQKQREHPNLRNRLGGKREDSVLGMKDTDYAQSINIDANLVVSTSSERNIGSIPGLSFDRRAYEISGSQSSSGTTKAVVSLTPSIAAIGLFVTQLW